MTEPIDIPGANGGGQITVHVKTPNGNVHAVTLPDSADHPAMIHHLKAEVESLYGMIFPGWSADQYPVKIYTDGWVTLTDDYEQLVNGTTYGASPDYPDAAQHQVQPDEIFQFDM
jgi:hypothetical protein